jgi:hypothetical protein
MSDLGVIRQWCETCQEATETWVDSSANSLCVQCDPPDAPAPWDWDGEDWDG